MAFAHTEYEKTVARMSKYKYGDCFHADLCEKSKMLVGFSRDNPAYCGMFLNSADVSSIRHGRWIEYTKVIIPEPYNKWEQAWKCSECGSDDGFVAYNFCPNCGAKMDGE